MADMRRALARLHAWLSHDPYAGQPLQRPAPQPLTSLTNPFADQMTPRQAEVLDFGWEVMKHQNVSHLFLWLAEDGWVGGHELAAWQHAPGAVAVRIKPWETLVLPLHTTLN